MTRKDLQQISRIRLKEAKALLDSGMWDGAYYLAGYSIECALKACIAKGTQRCEFPDKKRVDSSHSHNLLELLRIAGLEHALVQAETDDPQFRNKWDTVRLWSEQSLYKRNSAKSAKELLAAIDEKGNGVFKCIQLHW